MRVKTRFLDRALTPLFKMQNIKYFVGCLYNQPKRQRAAHIIHSYLYENAARANIFSSFVKYCQRGRSYVKLSICYLEKMEGKT